MKGYSIGQLASAAGVPTSTVRYYERLGLLKPDFRTRGNYRGYRDTALKRLRFIRSAQATGFNLNDVEELLRLTHSNNPPCDDVVTVMRKRLAGIRSQIKQLKQVERTLTRSLRACCKGESVDICNDIRRLNGHEIATSKPPRRKSARTS
jgi:MerR family mercuric resistance operon transcriptional regulator